MTFLELFSSKRLIFNIFNNPSRASILAQLIYVHNEFVDMETNGSSNFLPSVAYRQEFCKEHFFICKDPKIEQIFPLKSTIRDVLHSLYFLPMRESNIL